jgi:hypothetical protein
MKDVQMSKLFLPIRIGAVDLAHRVVLAPLTRMRADLPGSVPDDLMAKYYRQRVSRVRDRDNTGLEARSRPLMCPGS